MINLIKNELFKIVHKKSILILFIFCIIFLLINAFSYKESMAFDIVFDWRTDDYVYYLEEDINNYDLDDKKQLESYINDISSLEGIKVSKKYKIDSPEYYYFENEVYDYIVCMNEAKYLVKDDYSYNECKSAYDKGIAYLENFDALKYLEDRMKVIEDEMKLLNEQKVGGVIVQEEYDSSYDLLSYEKKVLDYRIKHKIFFANNMLSNKLEYVIDVYKDYSTYSNDESSYKYRYELKNYRELKELYLIHQYKLENDLFVEESMDGAADSVLNMFVGFDIFILMAVILISSTIVADEFNKGTIKQLLLKPYTRSKILTSKIIAVMLSLLGFIGIYVILAILINGIITGGFNSLFEAIYRYDFSSNNILSFNIVEYCFINFIAILPMLLILLMFVMVVSVISTNNAGAMIFGVLLVFLSIMTNDGGILNENVYINALIPVVNWDFRYYLFGGLHWFGHCNIILSSIVSIVTFVILTFVSYIVFKFKDIKNQ